MKTKNETINFIKNAKTLGAVYTRSFIKLKKRIIVKRCFTNVVCRASLFVVLKNKI